MKFLVELAACPSLQQNKTSWYRLLDISLIDGAVCVCNIQSLSCILYCFSPFLQLIARTFLNSTSNYIGTSILVLK